MPMLSHRRGGDDNRESDANPANSATKPTTPQPEGGQSKYHFAFTSGNGGQIFTELKPVTEQRDVSRL